MHVLFIVPLLFAASCCFSQSKNMPLPPASAASKNTGYHLRVFNQAIAVNDLPTATTALNYQLAEHGVDNVYADTLAMLYMQQGLYPQCEYWVNKRLEKSPENRTLLEMKGVCLEKSGRTKEAIPVFEKLFSAGRNPYHAYQLMELQYAIKRLTECAETAQEAETLAFRPEYRMTYSVGKQTATTQLEAGIYNIHALALFDLGNKTEARKYLEKALAVDSTFALARQNLNALLSLESENSGKGKSPADTREGPDLPAKRNDQN